MSETGLHVDVAATAEAAAERAAAWFVAYVTAVRARRGRCTVALSGGRTPWAMLAALPRHGMTWADVEVFQVDERVVPAADERRNALKIGQLLVVDGGLPAAQFHPLPVEAPDLRAAMFEHEALLRRLCGDPVVLDLVCLGLGSDGHTASLVPGDPLLAEREHLLGLTGLYQGTTRMSLTFPVLDQAAERLWLVTGADKPEALARLLAADPTIPAGCVRRSGIVMADAAAAALVRA